MIRVNRREQDSLDKMIRRFKKKCEREGLIKDMRKNEYYEKPSERKRRIRRRFMKQLAKEDI